MTRLVFAGTPDFALASLRALVEAGHVSTTDEAFRLYLTRGAPAYVSRKRATPEEAIRMIHDAGGLAVLAFVYTVPVWEHPVYDGYWIVLGITGLLVACNRLTWRRGA